MALPFEPKEIVDLDESMLEEMDQDGFPGSALGAPGQDVVPGTESGQGRGSVL